PIFVELGDERSPEIEPHIVAFPLGEPAPAGRCAGVFLRQILPPGPRAENPEAALKATAVIDPRPTTLLSLLLLGQVRLDPSPLLVGKALHSQLKIMGAHSPQLFSCPIAQAPDLIQVSSTGFETGSSRL